jgi:hypothetical protein
MLDQEFSYWHFGHELSHQWWGNLVRPTGPRGNYISTEAMAHWSGLGSAVSADAVAPMPSGAAELARRLLPGREKEPKD